MSVARAPLACIASRQQTATEPAESVCPIAVAYNPSNRYFFRMSFIVPQ